MGPIPSDVGPFTIFLGSIHPLLYTIPLRTHRVPQARLAFHTSFRTARRKYANIIGRNESRTSRQYAGDNSLLSKGHTHCPTGRPRDHLFVSRNIRAGARRGSYSRLRSGFTEGSALRYSTSSDLSSDAEFAFLSACHPAELTEQTITDEVLHPAAAMQFCGFRSVVGTMWAMADFDGRDLTKDTSLFSDGLQAITGELQRSFEMP